MNDVWLNQSLQSIAVFGGQLNVWLRPGSSPAAVFLHYWGGSCRTFNPVIAALSTNNAVVVFDQRGWGEARHLPGPYGIDQLADDALAVTTGLGLSNFVLVGHSMGGKVAQLVASRNPDGLCGVVLIAPAPPQPQPNINPDTIERRSHAYDNRDTVNSAIDRALTYTSLTAELREQVINDSLAANKKAKLVWPTEGMTQDISAATLNIDVPILVIAGEHDRVDPPASLLTDLLPFIPNAQFTIVADTGHLSPLEAPVALALHIDRFLTKLESP
jgi:pimeloyl-ACP methyl ester carboxylesterase